jgi:hypothetical protein
LPEIPSLWFDEFGFGFLKAKILDNVWECLAMATFSNHFWIYILTQGCLRRTLLNLLETY